MRRPLYGVFAGSAVAFAIFLGAGASSAAPMAAPTPVPRALPNFSSMQMFMGTWSCTQQLRGKTRPDTSTTAIGLGGAYMVTHDVAPPFDPYRRFPIIADSYLTRNPTTKQWVAVSVDSTGAYNISTSPGWNGNTLKTTTTLTPDGSTGYDVLTRLSGTRTVDRGVSTDSKGHVTRSTTTCNKIP